MSLARYGTFAESKHSNQRKIKIQQMTLEMLEDIITETTSALSKVENEIAQSPVRIVDNHGTALQNAIDRMIIIAGNHRRELGNPVVDQFITNMQNNPNPQDCITLYEHLIEKKPNLWCGDNPKVALAAAAMCCGAPGGAAIGALICLFLHMACVPALAEGALLGAFFGCGLCFAINTQSEREKEEKKYQLAIQKASDYLKDAIDFETLISAFTAPELRNDQELPVLRTRLKKLELARDYLKVLIDEKSNKKEEGPKRQAMVDADELIPSLGLGELIPSLGLRFRA